MARHNRDGNGTDQRGFDYCISYQPDWLRLVKVTRNLEGGRQSTKTLFRNPADRRESSPGDRVRTRIVSASQDIDFEITVASDDETVRRIQVCCELPPRKGSRRGEEVVFTLMNGLPPSGG